MKNIFLFTALLSAAAMRCAAFDLISDTTEFDDVGIFASGFALTNGPARMFPANERVSHDEATGATVDTDSHRDSRHGCFMHPPYKKGWGISFQEFTVTLPASPAAVIEGSTALSEGAETSDGVTYRVLVDGKPAWEEHRRSIAWQPFRADLSAWAGKTVTIRFEVTPGPKLDTAFDWALWSERRLLLPGFHGPDHPAPQPLDLKKLSSKENKSWAPLSGFDGSTKIKLEDKTATLSYRGDDGELAYTWKSDSAGSSAPFGKFSLNAKMAGDRDVEIPLVSGAQIFWTTDIQADETKITKHRGSVDLVRTFRNTVGEVATLVMLARIEGKSLVLDVTCDKPWIREFSPGSWGPVAIRRKLPMPYYGHEIEFLPAANIFVSRFPDWSASQASHFRSERAIYESLTDGTRNKLHERYIFSAAWHVDEVMANIPNPPSPWREYFGKRILLDIWNGDFANSAKSLNEMSKFDVRDDYIIYHCWQRDGYDNGLPAHFPAREKQGGEVQMTNLTAVAKLQGHRISLHENYVDYYPNYEHFTTNDVSLLSDGSLEKAWFNEGTGIQSFAVKPGAIMKYAREQSPEIHKRYDTTAGYLDVHSCVPLWFHVDQRAGEPDAGSLQSVWKTHRELWQFERDTHGGPETGEGNGHWPWSGWLDGVEAQFGTGWPGSQGLTAPLLVDFNLLRVHPLQINHGQGYYERWYSHTTPWGEGVPLAIFDQYRMQEIAFGHIGFLGHDYWRKPNIAWLEQHLVPPVSSRHATEKIRDIAYNIGGKWLDATEATKRGIAAKLAPMENFGRVRIVYENGLTIIANSVTNDFAADGWTLPQFGWIATNKNFSAGTVRRDGVTVDFVNSPDYQFANARRARDWNMGGPLPVTVHVAEFQSLENKIIKFSYDWKTDVKLNRDLHCFVHFDKPGKHEYHWETLAQLDHATAKKTTEWQVGETLHDGPYEMTLDLPDGRYAWRIGLFDKIGRLSMDGPTDGTGRVRLGNIVISGGGKKIHYEPEKELGVSSTDLFRQNVNLAEKEIDFGFVKTAGSVLRKREHGEWKQWTYPDSGDFHTEFAH